ncbi:helix-turn-helix domain-containing protein [Lactococcus nasutitermitis]|uniref:Helix-turn-helix domain-containing protein n=1 Tax=Lactococcus nasutitermitis TaxID=1652957 RepID=A0ABV9JBU0_9LACT|nr:helix-turn-helix transcriptional regulator [Lactococcus nasutitermitis]
MAAEIKKDERLATLRSIRSKMKEKRVTTAELAKKLQMDSVNLSDFLFSRKVPDTRLIEDIWQALEHIEDEEVELEVAVEVETQTKTEVDKIAKLTEIIVNNDKEREDELSFDEEKLTEYLRANFESSQPPVNLGKKIRGIRERAYLSQEELAKNLQPPISSDIVSYWENNMFIPTLDYCVQLSDLGVVTLDWLLK